MTNLVLYSFLLIFVGVSSADEDYSTTELPLSTVSSADEDYTTTGLPLPTECTINDIDIFSIPKGDALIINETIYDNMKETTLVDFVPGRDATYITMYAPNNYVSKFEYVNWFRVEPINEKIEISQPSEKFYYNFTLYVRCAGIYYTVDTLLPIHETNTYTPVFSNEVYEYALFSPFNEDLQRLIELNPIVANDNDMSNTEVKFWIEPNDYFDLQYEGIVMGSLNKNHTARLIPKNSTIDIAQNLEFIISVTDLGYPPKSSNATIILKPLNLKFPTFKEAYYVGDYYLNNTFIMRSQPELDFTGIGKNYKIEANLEGNLPEYDANFDTNIIGNGTVAIVKEYNLDELAIYKYTYLMYTLKISYTDTSFNNYITKGSATVLVELHR